MAMAHGIGDRLEHYSSAARARSRPTHDCAHAGGAHAEATWVAAVLCRAVPLAAQRCTLYDSRVRLSRRVCIDLCNCRSCRLGPTPAVQHALIVDAACRHTERDDPYKRYTGA